MSLVHNLIVKPQQSKGPITDNDTRKPFGGNSRFTAASLLSRAVPSMKMGIFMNIENSGELYTLKWSRYYRDIPATKQQWYFLTGILVLSYCAKPVANDRYQSVLCYAWLPIDEPRIMYPYIGASKFTRLFANESILSRNYCLDEPALIFRKDKLGWTVSETHKLGPFQTAFLASLRFVYWFFHTLLCLYFTIRFNFSSSSMYSCLLK